MEETGIGEQCYSYNGYSANRELTPCLAHTHWGNLASAGSLCSSVVTFTIPTRTLALSVGNLRMSTNIPHKLRLGSVQCIAPASRQRSASLRDITRTTHSHSQVVKYRWQWQGLACTNVHVRSDRLSKQRTEKLRLQHTQKECDLILCSGHHYSTISLHSK